MRIGVVEYTNTLPLADGLQEFLPQAALVAATPAEIATRLENGELDVGLVPVAALAAHPEWQVVPGLGIASRGPVRSVVLVAPEPVDRITRLVADPASRTSNVLARLWLRQRTGRMVDMVEGAEDAASRFAAGATVIIGDAALSWSSPGETHIDLGEAWTEWTGHPFVYAVWAGPGAHVPGLARGLNRCFTANRNRIGVLAGKAAGGDPDRASMLESYLSHSIRYRLEEEESRGLRLYLTLAREAGLLPAVPDERAHVHAH